MIESISIKGTATFDDTGVNLNNLRKINFVYGANACGKTTISKFLNSPNETEFKNCLVRWQHNTPLKTLVYNKVFRDEHLQQEKIPGVFTLGKATKEEKEAIEKMVGDLELIKSDGVSKKNTLAKLKEEQYEIEENFKEAAWQKLYKKYENDFKDAFYGSLSKERFKDKLICSVSVSSEIKIKEYDNLAKQAQTIFGDAPTRIEPIHNISFERQTQIEQDDIWSKKILGKTDIPIAQLIQNLNMNDWINTGREYLQDNNNICPFCQQETISGDFRKQLDEYFDESFKSDMQQLKNLREEYYRIFNNLISQLESIEAREKGNAHSKLNKEAFSVGIKTVFSQYQTNKERIEDKIKEPSRVINLVSLESGLDGILNLIKTANVEIAKHNDIVQNYNAKKNELIQDIWNFIVAEYRTEINEFIKLRNGKQKGVDALEKNCEKLRIKYRDLDKQIKDANKNVTSVQPTVDQINKLLKAYGFLGFEIVPAIEVKNCYQIKRGDGSIANQTLSEGEITFITFLYFLHLAKGGITQENVTEERILVIDDPISSLDSNVLFIVSSLTKEIIKAIKGGNGTIRQIIILTHNVYFHKETSFIDGRTRSNKDTHYWILCKRNNVSFVQEYMKENPINSSYELLWKEIKERNNSSITVQNTMRRIIEHYFKILGKYGDDDLIEHFPCNEEQIICKALLSWINDGSHGVSDDLFIEISDEDIEKYHSVFENIFKYTGHIEHYNMMMGKVDEDKTAEVLETSL
jgi:wobble nucleotide-excising tRNase